MESKVTESVTHKVSKHELQAQIKILHDMLREIVIEGVDTKVLGNEILYKTDILNGRKVLEKVKPYLDVDLPDPVEDPFFSINWYASDVIAKYPDLTNSQAEKVLALMEKSHDCNEGTSYTSIDSAVQSLGFA
jgi:hypothetical protein